MNVYKQTTNAKLINEMFYSIESTNQVVQFLIKKCDLKVNL